MRHLKDSKMSYFEHLSFAMKLSVQLNVMALVSFIHAIFPFVLQNHVSSGIKDLNDKLKEVAG
jgi:hypothetical protein|tara:strand:+ start:2387 stop:2575 length:189 start_codon:yes stop_codon:yes gene_type:complete